MEKSLLGRLGFNGGAAWTRGLWLATLSAALLAGCNYKPVVAPVSGKVLYNGQPLPYGNIVFQPSKGQPAGGAIQADGSFRLSTFREYDGAIIGPHKVRVSCYASQRPAAKANKGGGEATLGESLIPSQYGFADTSGLTADVKAEGNDSFVFELTGPKRTFPQ
jgi:hypothetical protein